MAGIELDPKQTALTFSQLVEGLWIGWAADPQAIAPVAAACCHRYIDLVLGAARPCQPPVPSSQAKTDSAAKKRRPSRVTDDRR